MLISRRKFVKDSLLASALFAFPEVLGGCSSSGGSEEDISQSSVTYRMPEESARHLQTWMAFGAQEKIWGADLLPEVQRNLVEIARVISKYEKVSILVGEEEVSVLQELLGSSNVSIFSAKLDDLWMRDTSSIFVLGSDSSRAAVDFNFNGWGGKQEFSKDTEVARIVAEESGVKLLSTSVVMEGGCIEVDGAGTAIVTESCTLNPNRNPGVGRENFEFEMKRLLGVEKIIWLPGVSGQDITDGHTDFYARFVKPGVVLIGIESDPDSFDYKVTRNNREILRSATDAQGRQLQVLELESPYRIRTTFETDDFVAGYLGYYVCNGAVLIQEFGDPTRDRAARDVIQSVYPNRVVEQLNIDGIAAGGGSIHCATQQEV